MAIPAVMDWRLAPRRPGPSDSRLQYEAGFINEEEGATLTPGFF
jgi:hypothetical protein